MNSIKQEFTQRQYMINRYYEYFHYMDGIAPNIEYHTHDFYEIYYAISGEITYYIEGKSYRPKPGDIILINNKEFHKPVVEHGETYERMVIWVNPDYILKQSTDNCNLSLCFESNAINRFNLLRPSKDNQYNLEEILVKIEKIYDNEGFGNEILLNIYMTELLVLLNKIFLSSQNKDVETDIEHNEKINKVIRYINENIEGELSLDSITDKFFLSKYHLLREFKKYAGYTIHQYIQHKRLITAKGLLKEGMRVTDACSLSGFGDYSNFIRAFKKSFGVSPKKYCKIQA